MVRREERRPVLGQDRLRRASSPRPRRVPDASDRPSRRRCDLTKTRQLVAPTADGSTTILAPSACTHCGACYGSEASHYGSFTCIKEFKNQGLGFYHGGQEHVCKHFYAGWDCHATPGYCDDANSAGMYVGNYEGEDTCCAGTDTSYAASCDDFRELLTGKTMKHRHRHAW